MRLSPLKCFSQVRGFRESFVAFVHNGSIVQIVLKIRSLYQLWLVMNCASGNLQVTVEISLVGFIIQSNGSELSDNVYFNVYISFIFHLKVYMTWNWFWSLGKFNQQFWTLKMCLPKNFLNFDRPKTAFSP